MRNPNVRRRTHTRARRWRSFLAATALAAGVLGIFGCDSMSDGQDPKQDGTTLDASVDESEVPDDVLVVASVDPPDPSMELSIKANPVFCCDPLAMDFEATFGESDAGSGLRYEWAFGDGRTAEGRSVKHTFPWSGLYLVQVTVRHDGGTVETAELEISVGPAGDGYDSPDDTDPPPDPVEPDDGVDAVDVIADAGPDLDVLSGATVVLDGSSSVGVEALDLQFTWRQVVGPLVELNDATDESPTFTAPPVGEETEILAFELTVTQGDVAASDRVEVRVWSDAMTQVVADAGADQEVVSGTAVALSGVESTGTGHVPLSFLWTQVSGPRVGLTNPTSATATFTAPTATAQTEILLFELVVAQGTVIDADRVVVRVSPDATHPAPVDRAQLLAWMRELDPLPKVHYCWPVPQEMLIEGDAVLYEYVRLTRSVGIFGMWKSQPAIEKAVEMCDAVTHSDTAAPATIAINYSPWHWRWPEDLPPTHTGPEHDEVIEYYYNLMSDIKEWLDQANARLGSDVQVSVLLLNTERFQVREENEPNAEAWNAAIDDKYDSIFNVCKEVFPDARVEWYGRATAPWHFTGQELGNGFATWLYNLPFVDRTRAMFRSAYESAQALGSGDVMPWIALAAGYHLDQEGEPWDFDWNFDLRFSWQIGAEVNDPYYGDHPAEYAPWHAAWAATFYPGPFDQRVPYWGEHFVAYVRGAHGITELP